MIDYDRFRQRLAGEQSATPATPGEQVALPSNRLNNSDEAAGEKTALAERLEIRRNACAGPVRLVVGFLRILLVVENWPPSGWRVLDYFPLTSESDRDLLMVTQEMQSFGYPDRNAVKAKLCPAVFSPHGVKDPEAKAAMTRLGRRGFEISSRVVGIRDPEFLSWADGGRIGRARRGR
jgi:hypothetical protein